MISNPVLNQSPTKVKRALISVFDKTGVVSLAQSLNSLGVEILSTGGTAAALKNAGIPVTDVSDYTNFPEIMDGRVKTINPLIEGGILGLRDQHKEDALNNKIKWIDVVVCNLYPFSDMINREDRNQALAMENVDIGGPTMIRAAAKNVGWVSVVVDSSDYISFAKELESGSIAFKTRKKLATKAFGHTSQYDSTIYNYLSKDPFPDNLTITYKKHSLLRYGENPHQTAAAYKITDDRSNSVLNAKIHQGKPLSYNNIMDADAALSC
jgi:AICAR transformylase/IMP cyclohydrolase PurH (only IMP cyclohydrolase domain in Aful)